MKLKRKPILIAPLLLLAVTLTMFVTPALAMEPWEEEGPIALCSTGKGKIELSNAALDEPGIDEFYTRFFGRYYLKGDYSFKYCLYGGVVQLDFAYGDYGGEWYFDPDTVDNYRCIQTLRAYDPKGEVYGDPSIRVITFLKGDDGAFVIVYGRGVRYMGCGTVCYAEPNFDE